MLFGTVEGKILTKGIYCVCQLIEYTYTPPLCPESAKMKMTVNLCMTLNRNCFLVDYCIVQ